MNFICYLVDTQINPPIVSLGKIKNNSLIEIAFPSNFRRLPYVSLYEKSNYGVWYEFYSKINLDVHLH